MIQQVTLKLKASPWVAFILAFIGWIVYFFQAWINVYIQTSVLDEGGYLYIGDLFSRGIIRPFQDFGAIRQYAPLAYLIPGQIENWIGAGLQTGRFFSVFCGLMLVIAVWIVSQRLGGNWIAAAVIWGMALTPISIQIYSLAISQALVACLLAWSLLCVLGEERKLWQIISGSFLMGIMIMTRQNLIPVLPLLVAYIFWQHGKKAGIWAIIASLFPIIVIHILYWPNILQIWATWLPVNLTPFLDPFRVPIQPGFLPGTSDILGSYQDITSRFLSFLLGIRFHYFTMVGFILCVFLWPHRTEWKSQSSRRIAWTLATLFLVLTVIHAWASFLQTQPYCTFCFTPYLAFFDFIVFLLIAVSIRSWRRSISRITEVVIGVVIVVVSAGLGYAAFDRLGPWILSIKFPAVTRGINPRNWIPFITLWDILANKFHMDYWISRVYVSIAAGAFLGVILFILGICFYKIYFRKRQAKSYSFGSWILISCLALGVVLSPLMGGTYRDNGICLSNNIKSYEKIGYSLSLIIPPGSQVFWDVGTAVPLLYAPNITIHYPQAYGTSVLVEGENTEQLFKLGLWNDTLAGQWWDEADYIVIEHDYAGVYHPANFDPSQFNISQTGPINPCDPSSYFNIYERKR